MNLTKSKTWLAVRSSVLTATSGYAATHEPAGGEKSYTGTVAAIDPQARVLNVKGWALQRRTFNLGDNCACSQLEKRDATVNDLRPGEKITVRYLDVQGVRIAIRIEQEPMRLTGVVRALDAESRKLTLHQTALDHEFQLADDCQIVFCDGTSGTLADIEVGHHVTVTFETPDNMPTARRIEQTSAEFAGTLTAIDLDDKMVKAKSLSGAKKFNVAANCAIVLYGRLDARLADLRPEDKLVVSYDEIKGINVANRIAVMETQLTNFGPMPGL